MSSEPMANVSGSATSPQAGPRERVESELVVVLLRALVILIVLLAPRILREPIQYTRIGYIVLAFAALYTAVTAVVAWRGLSLPYHRHVMVLTDLALVTVWLSLVGERRQELFPLYYLITIVAALWFKVFGSVLTATLAAFLYVYVSTWGAAAPDEALLALRHSVTVNVPFLYLVALLAGYLAEVEERQRQESLDAQVLIAQYEREMMLSRHIQDLLLPGQIPDLPGLDVAVHCDVARVIGGGDYYDVFALPDGSAGICIADVAGKSVQAQIRLPLLKYALRAAAPLYDSPAEVVRHLNQLVYDDLQPDMFIGLCYTVFDADRQRVRICNAGHSPPLVCRSRGAEMTPTTQVALGILTEYPYQQQEYSLQSGDSLVFYTDGVTSARNADGEEFGEDRLMAWARQTSGATARQVVDSLLAQVREFEVAGRSDDLTVLVATCSAPDQPEPS